MCEISSTKANLLYLSFKRNTSAKDSYQYTLWTTFRLYIGGNIWFSSFQPHSFGSMLAAMGFSIVLSS